MIGFDGTRRDFLKTAGLGAAVMSLPSGLTAMGQNASSKPNVVVILADDLGYGDLSAYGATDLKTPNIDGLIAAGMRFDRFYANCPVCSPTRASLLTGRFPDLVGVPGVIRTHIADNWGYLLPQAILLPQLLKRAGYHTATHRQMASGPGLAEHAQRTRLRPFPRLPRRHDGRLLHPSPPRLQLHAA